jgi:hypothetical protein
MHSILHILQEEIDILKKDCLIVFVIPDELDQKDVRLFKNSKVTVFVDHVFAIQLLLLDNNDGNVMRV